MGVPPYAWFIRENPFKQDDLWRYPHLWKPPNVAISPPLESKCFVSFGELINTTFILSEPRLQRKAIQSLTISLK